MKTVFIVNNKNNRLAKVLPRIKHYCQQNLPDEVEFLITLGRRHAIQLARQAAEDGCDYLVAVGGDGTLHEAVNGVLLSNLAANHYPALGVLPWGSANDFARTAGISASTEALVERIKTNRCQKIDLGKIVLHPSGETRYFINIAGVGLGPEVVQKMEKSSSVLGPGFNYFKQIIRGFISYKKKAVSCRSAAWQWQGKLLQMAVANGRYFGNAICIAPDARLADGQFQVALFGDLSLWDYLKNLGKLKKGVKINHPQVHYYQANEVILESDEACGIEADGEYVGLAPATIRVLPEAICFVLPCDHQ